MNAAFRRPSVGLLRVTGRDRIRWLQGMLTNDVTSLATGKGCLATACTRQGKMIAVCSVHRFDDEVLLEVDPAALLPLQDHFQRLIVMDQVTLTDATPEWIHFEVVGSSVARILELPDLRLFDSARWMSGWCVARLHATAPRYRIRVPKADEESVLARLRTAGLHPLTDEESERLRIEAGLPRWGIDMTSDDLPMEAGLEPAAISYTKGCYLGQEVILRVRNFGEPPRRLVSLVGNGPTPPARDTALWSGGENVGKITSAAPAGDNSVVALGYVRKTHKTSGTIVEARDTDRIVPLTVRELPWHTHLDQRRSP